MTIADIFYWEMIEEKDLFTLTSAVLYNFLIQCLFGFVLVHKV